MLPIMRTSGSKQVERFKIGAPMRDPTTENWKDSTLGVSCTPECPSDLALDAMAVDECTASQVEVLKKHIAQCQSCEARWDLRQQGIAALLT